MLAHGAMGLRRAFVRVLSVGLAREIGRVLQRIVEMVSHGLLSMRRARD